MPHPAERRAWPRCDAVKNRSSMEFVTPHGLRRIKARLLNISRDGALLVAENFLPRSTRVSLRMEIPVKTDWVDARIVRVGQDLQIGLKFCRGCADDLLLAGAVGIDLAFMLRGGANGTTACD